MEDEFSLLKYELSIVFKVEMYQALILELKKDDLFMDLCWESSLGTWRLESELRLSGNHPE